MWDFRDWGCCWAEKWTALEKINWLRSKWGSFSSLTLQHLLVRIELNWEYGIVDCQNQKVVSSLFHLDVDAEAAMELLEVVAAEELECFLADTLACDGLRPYWCKPPPLLPAAPAYILLIYDGPMLPACCLPPAGDGDDDDCILLFWLLQFSVILIVIILIVWMSHCVTCRSCFYQYYNRRSSVLNANLIQFI